MVIMEKEKIKEMLEARFDLVNEYPKKRRIIFWYDEEKAFKDIISDLELRNAKVIILSKGLNRRGETISTNIFKTKYILEYEDIESNYLIYSEYPKPIDKENYLVDIEKYSEYFMANKSAMILEEFKLDRLNYSLLEVIKKHIEFFASKERKEKLAKILNGLDIVDEEKLKLSILSVSVGSKNIDISEILKDILLDRRKLEAVEKWIGLDFLFEKIKEKFGLEIENFDKFIKILVVTNLYRELQEKPHTNLSKYYTGKTNDIYFFVSSILQNKQISEKIMELISEVAKELDIERLISSVSPENIVQGISLEYYDKYIIGYLLENINSQILDFEKYNQYIDIRLDNSLWKEKYKNYYKMLIAIIKIYNLKDNFYIKDRDNLEGIFGDYINRYYEIDKLYRKFYFYYDDVKNKNDLDEKEINYLNEIENKISYFYEKDYLEELLPIWADKIKNNNIPLSIQNYQKNFYKSYVEKSDTRIAVIISDGLRFEVGEEITEKLRKDISSKKIILNGMLTELPSITSVGMTNLLPNKNRVVDPYNKIFSVDDINTKSTENREKILKSSCEESSAITFSNFKNMARAEQDGYIKGKKVIYIYHDAIDSIGDKAKTENDTFNACQIAVEEIFGIIKLLSSLGVVNIVVTSDHGFLYERKTIEEYNKIDLENEIFNEGKRYGFSEKLIEQRGCTTIKLDNYYGIFPIKNQRFKTSGGGLQFVHGGISPQEMIIPVIQYIGGVNSKKIDKVGVRIKENIRKITSNLTKFSLYQLEAVSEKEKIKERNVSVCLYSGDIKVSNEIKLTLNSLEENTQYDFKLTLSGNHKNVTLKVMDLETENILDSKEYSVNIGIIAEFDF